MSKQAQPKTQLQRIMSFLDKGKTFSVDQATAYGIGNIRARITELRQKGHNIQVTKNSKGTTAYQLVSVTA